VERVRQNRRIGKKEKISRKLNQCGSNLLEVFLLERDIKLTEVTQEIIRRILRLVARDNLTLENAFLKIRSFNGDLTRYTKKIDSKWLKLINTPEKKAICNILEKILTEWDKNLLQKFQKLESLRMAILQPNLNLTEILNELAHGLLLEDIHRVIYGLDLEIIEQMLQKLQKLQMLIPQPVINLVVVNALAKMLSPAQKEKVLKMVVSQREPNIEILRCLATSGVNVSAALHKTCLLSSPAMHRASAILFQAATTSVRSGGKPPKRFAFDQEDLKKHQEIEELKIAISQAAPDFVAIDSTIKTLSMTARETILDGALSLLPLNFKVLNILIHYVLPEVRDKLIGQLDFEAIQNMLVFSGCLPFVPNIEVVKALIESLSVDKKERTLRMIVSHPLPNPEVVEAFATAKVNTDAALNKMLLLSNPDARIVTSLYVNASEPIKRKSLVTYETLLKKSEEGSLVAEAGLRKLTL
jgi:hypothetical protein